MGGIDATELESKAEFRNDSKGQIGVIIVDGDNKAKGIPVKPNATILLSEREQILTANAPKLDKDNPFTNGTLTLIRKAGELKHRRPIGSSQTEEATQQEQEAAEEARAAAEARKKEEAARTARVKAQQAEAKRQGEQGARPLPPKPADPPATPPTPPAVEQTADETAAAAAKGERQSEDETAAAPQAGGPAAEGSRPPGEEVGTPDATPKAAQE